MTDVEHPSFGIPGTVRYGCHDVTGVFLKAWKAWLSRSHRAGINRQAFRQIQIAKPSTGRLCRPHSIRRHQTLRQIDRVLYDISSCLKQEIVKK